MSARHAKILKEAQKRFAACETWEADVRKLFREDLKFDAADSDNGWQWPDDIVAIRDGGPCLTINEAHQHNLQVINDGKQNKPAVKIRPTGGGATYQSAQVYDGVVRRIEYISNGQAAYDTAYSFAVRGGVGYWRLLTDYIDDESFDQDIFIRRIRDPLCVYLDPDISEADGSDARFGFVFVDTPREEVEREYPSLKGRAANAQVGQSGSWLGKDHIRVAEYYRRVAFDDELILMVEADVLPTGEANPRAGETTVVLASRLGKEITAAAKQQAGTRTRPVTRYRVEWFKIVGDEVVDSREKDDALPIPYVPIVRVTGEETIIEGKLDRKSHTRCMKDSQRMLNYWVSGAAEQVALQPKMPFTGAAEAFAGYEDYWRTANKAAHAFLPYNHKDANNDALPPPTRLDPPVMAPAFIQGMQMAKDNLMSVSGQHQAQMGEPSNERSGYAINQRQRQGDRATYHFIDSLAMAIRYTGKILIAWIPHVYDTRRVMRIMAEDGTEQEVVLDPQAREALIEKRNEQQEIVESIFNPNVGTYDVQADVGPGYATRRQEAFNAVSQIAAQNMELMQVVGDILFKNADFPGADELSERLRRMVPQHLLGEGPTPEMAELMAKSESMKSLIEQMVRELADKDLKLEQRDTEIRKVAAQRDIDRSEMRADTAIDSYKAETDRMKVVATAMGPEQIAAIVAQVVQQALMTPLPPDEDEAPELPPVPAGELYDPFAAAQGAR